MSIIESNTENGTVDPYPINNVSFDGKDYEYIRRYGSLISPQDVNNLITDNLYVTDSISIGSTAVFSGDASFGGMTTADNFDADTLTSSQSTFTGISTFNGNVIFTGITTSNNLSVDTLTSSQSTFTGISTFTNIIITGITTVGLGTTSAPSNSQLSFELSNDNLSLRIRVKGTDGVTRVGIVTLS